VSGLTKGPGISISITQGLAGNYTIGLSSMVGSYLDATMINHNGTLMTENAQNILHLNFPASRECSATVSMPVVEVPSSGATAKLWMQVYGTGAGTFSVSYYFIPATATASLGNAVVSSLTATGSANVYSIAEADGGISISSAGLLIAVLSRSSSLETPADILRIGFKLS